MLNGLVRRTLQPHREGRQFNLNHQHRQKLSPSLQVSDKILLFIIFTWYFFNSRCWEQHATGREGIYWFISWLGVQQWNIVYRVCSDHYLFRGQWDLRRETKIVILKNLSENSELVFDLTGCCVSRGSIDIKLYFPHFELQYKLQLQSKLLNIQYWTLFLSGSWTLTFLICRLTFVQLVTSLFFVFVFYRSTS